jgi:glycosidase
MRRSKICAAVAAILSVIGIGASAQTPEFGGETTQITHPDWVKNAVIYEVNLRQGTSQRTFKGFEKELPRLQCLGVDILWFMPIHPISELNRKGELGSYYAVADYKKVNPEFGSMKDFRELVAAAHECGMKVIIDEVCNHTGCDNHWVDCHPEYYAVDEKGKMFGPFDWTDTYKLNYNNSGLRRAMKDALNFWVKEVGIDGFRCDVAGEVPTDFWEEAREELNEIKPVFMLAEASKPELLRKAFDSDYNWPMKETFSEIANAQGVNKFAVEHNIEHKFSNALTIDTVLNRQAKQYPKGAINMQMITNHDLNSWEGTEFDRLGEGVDAFAVLTYTLPGIPMMYTGQEVGFNHAFEFFKQDITPDYTANAYTTFYTKLNNLRHSNAALWCDAESAKMQRYATANPNVYVFSRERNGQKVVVVANLSNSVAKVKFKGKSPAVKGLVNYFTDVAAAMPKQLGAWEYLLFTTPLN